MSELLVEIPYSHLHPGLILDAPAGTTDFLVVFGDGSEARAELLRDHADRPLLRVGGYVTAHGAVSDERVWTIREIAPHGDRDRIRLGDALT
ncbi:hypothetical protein SAMN05421874_103318 [Nonomuraea maritima]|uniref:Uncharacterized protein n=1 Tax=Nonomuraea maritima TaxID=683260 RepID=A0A1G8WXT6_9ACTN|nr:hypothetical protein [Nonomuraea maritima]SDJ82435.1 hypothetical protein SAMN05421874_103318 [Nonomuraea maritima]